MTSPSLLETIRSSFTSSIGDIVFGMEDGSVSIFGLVFGVAATASDAHLVLLAGGAGAAAAAVSMMAGSYLEVASQRDAARARIAEEKREVELHPEKEAEEICSRLRADGFTDAEADLVAHAFMRNPAAMLHFETDTELHLGMAAEESPVAHALWMLAADVFAAATPVIPFALFPLDTARIVSLVITTILLTLLGIGRGLIARTSIPRAVIETLLVAAGAALAGVLIGKLVGSGTG